MKHVGVASSPQDVASQQQLTWPRSYQQAMSPAGPRRAGDTWLNLSTGVEYEWVVTASGGQWVEQQNSQGSTLYTTATDIEITDATKGVILRSPDGTRWRVTIDNAGTLTRTSL